MALWCTMFFDRLSWPPTLFWCWGYDDEKSEDVHHRAECLGHRPLRTRVVPFSAPVVAVCEHPNYTLEDDAMDPENHWLVEENTLPGGQDVRVYVSFRECKRPRFFQVIRKVSGSTASADPPLWHRGRPEIETAWAGDGTDSEAKSPICAQEFVECLGTLAGYGNLGWAAAVKMEGGHVFLFRGYAV